MLLYQSLKTCSIGIEVGMHRPHSPPTSGRSQGAAACRTGSGCLVMGWRRAATPSLAAIR